MNNLTFIILFIATLILLVAYVVFVAIYNHQMLRKHSIQLQEAYRQTQTKELSAQEKTLNDLIAQCAVIHKQILHNCMYRQDSLMQQ